MKKKVKSKGNKAKGKTKIRKFKVKQNISKIAFRCFILLLSIFLFIGIIYGIYFSFTSSKFNISKIEVKGNKEYTKEEIIKRSEIKLGGNINKVNKLKVASNIKDMVYVESINIDRKYPNKIVINVKERVAKYAAHNKDKNIYIKLTNKGVILEEAMAQYIEENEIILFGMHFVDEINIGDKIEKTELDKIIDLETIIKEYEKSGNSNKITSIKFENGIYVLTLEYKTDIMIDINNNLEYKMSFLKEIITETGILPGIIDMTKPNPYFSQKAG